MKASSQRWGPAFPGVGHICYSPEVLETSDFAPYVKAV